MVSLLAALAACSGVEAPSPPPPTPPAPPAPEARPDGRIRAEPILPVPVVVGAIDAAAVDAGIGRKRAEIEACYEAARAARPKLAGKVLVKFLIGPDGRVTEAETRSTSLRHPEAEACVNARVAEATFPPLAEGKLAVVTYPFVFPRP